MNRKKLFLTAAIICVCFAIAFLWRMYGTYTVILDEAAIQAQVNKQLNKEFPVKGKAGIFVKGVTVTAATVHIEGDHLTSEIKIQGRLVKSKNFVLNATAEGVPEFSDGAFYFKPTKVEFKDVVYEGKSPSEAIQKFADRYLSDKKKALLLSDSAPKFEDWITDVAESGTVHALQTHPVYRPGDNMKGLVISAAMESVKVHDNKVEITLTLWKLTMSVLIGIALLIVSIVMLVVFARNPTFLSVVELTTVLG